MSRKRIAHIISHTHWDREWYLNSKYTNEWLIPFFDKLFDVMAREKDYVFVLDGQISMIEDYFEELAKGGSSAWPKREMMKKYIKEKRLFVGPYYLQPDWQLLSEEALVRNLLIGHKEAEKLGGVMKIGWMLDNFGQISQTAQIHKGFGIKGLYVWRGVEMDPQNVQSEFLWEAPDGTKLPAIYLINSYRNVMRLAEYKEIMKDRIYDEVEKLKDFATTPHILLMNGYDQEIVPDEFLEYIKDGAMDSDELEIIQSNPVRYLDSVVNERPELITLKGPLYSGRFIAVFPGVLSSRMYLKLQNDHGQKSLEKYAEPLSALIWTLGGEYEGNILEQIWKNLMKNHPHDSICGVSIDDVHRDMEERSRTVQNLTDSQIRRKALELSSIIDTSSSKGERAYILFNPSFYDRSEVIYINGQSRYISDIPAMGYKVVYEEEEYKVKDAVTVCENIIENSKIAVEIMKDGSFNVKDKKTEKHYKGLGVFEDKGDAGDEYNYSHPDVDKIITSKEQKAEIEYINISPEQVKVKIKIVLEVPEALEKNRKSRKEKMRELPIVTYITVDADSSVIKCKTGVKNTVKDHILRVLFPTDIISKVSFAGSPFDVVERPIHIDDYDESTIPEKVKKVIIGAREAKPNTIFLQRELVDLNDGAKGLSILSKGLPEYQILSERNTIAVTLFRSIGWITKEINTRIGDAGPEMYTPDAQCLRQMVFEYAVYPHEGDVVEGGVVRESELFNTDIFQIQTVPHRGSLPEKCSFFRLDDSERALKVTGFKRDEDGNRLIIRCFNASDNYVEASLKTYFPILNASYVNLLEQEIEEIKPKADNEIKVAAKAKQIVTIGLEVKRDCKKVSDRVMADIVETKEPEALHNYGQVAAVIDEDIIDERKRAEALKSGLDNPMLRRTALEAQLSAILTQNRFNEQEIHRLGYLLNDARVKRRVYDYIREYVNREEKK